MCMSSMLVDVDISLLLDYCWCCYITLQDDDVILDELNIEVQIYSQYVKVSVDAVVFNPHDGVQLADFNLRLPEQAFISYFHM